MKILVVEDHVLMREALRRVLKDDIKVAKAKSPEPVASAPQAKPLRDPDEFGE